MARFSALAREFYANMVGMREDSVYVRGVWVPFGHKRINVMFKLKELKHCSKFKENPHYAINRGSLTEEPKVWFYFLFSVILPTKHLCSMREQEAIILYALLKGYKINVGVISDQKVLF